MIADNLAIPAELLADLCRRWRIKRLSLFGSVLRDDFDVDSDVDVLIAFCDDAEWSLWDWIELVEELRQFFGRSVDVTEESGLRNPFRRQEIMRTRMVIYGD